MKAIIQIPLGVGHYSGSTIEVVGRQAGDYLAGGDSRSIILMLTKRVSETLTSPALHQDDASTMKLL